MLWFAEVKFLDSLGVVERYVGVALRCAADQSWRIKGATVRTYRAPGGADKDCHSMLQLWLMWSVVRDLAPIGDKEWTIASDRSVQSADYLQRFPAQSSTRFPRFHKIYGSVVNYFIYNTIWWGFCCITYLWKDWYRAFVPIVSLKSPYLAEWTYFR